MKTLFLFVLLFTLVAFAFKEPNQSAWDFARDVGTSVSNRVAPETKDEIEERPELSAGAPANEDLRTFNDHLSQVEKFIAPRTTSSSKAKSKPVTSPEPKPRPRATTKTKLAEKSAPASSEDTGTVADTSEPKITLEPAPDLQAKPIPKVAVEKLTPPRFEAPTRPTYRPINVDELAEMGRRYDRASRLLSEIK